jgi:hypothetical protein
MAKKEAGKQGVPHGSSIRGSGNHAAAAATAAAADHADVKPKHKAMRLSTNCNLYLHIQATPQLWNN